MEREKLVRSLWLNCMCRHRPTTIQKCVSQLGGEDAILDGGASVRDIERIFGGDYPTVLERDLTCAENLLDECEKKGIRLVHITDDNYPMLLRNTTTPPRILYELGADIDLNKYFTLAVVGSRDASDDKKRFTRSICKELADSGVLIVSGMARGLDAEAHMGALDAGQLTVAVLAGGVDVVYPVSNRELYEKISERGMIVSEQPPGVKGRDYFYQERNRIIAGICNGILVTGGSDRSGTAITAKYAQMYDRDIFAVPGSPIDEGASLPNGLIHDGAVTVLSYEDIVDEYSDRFYELLDHGVMSVDKNMSASADDRELSDRTDNASDTPEDRMKRYDFSAFGPSESKIVKYMCNFDEPVHIDEIIRNTDLRTSDVNSAVVLLQLKGIIRQQAGNLYTLE